MTEKRAEHKGIVVQMFGIMGGGMTVVRVERARDGQTIFSESHRFTSDAEWQYGEIVKALTAETALPVDQCPIPRCAVHNTPAEARTGISDRAAAALEDVSQLRLTLTAMAGALGSYPATHVEECLDRIEAALRNQ